MDTELEFWIELRCSVLISFLLSLFGHIWDDRREIRIEKTRRKTFIQLYAAILG